MKAFIIPLLVAAMAYPCFGQTQDPFEPSPDQKTAEETESARFFGDGPVDLNSIRGKPIKTLDFMACDKLTDISALRGMKLEDLTLWKTPVEDISPLAGMPIRKLVIFGARVKDLSPLKGMPLESLWVSATYVADFSPLKGLPLKDLNLFSSEATDLSPLAGMPLETLELGVVDSGKITDLTPLQGMKLKSLDRLDANTITKGMDIIRDMKSLEEINGQPPAEFWKKYDSDAPVRQRLRELGINYRDVDVADDGWTLRFYGDDIRDLSVLKGLPISVFVLIKSSIGDLSPLAEMKLRSLNLGSSAVKDLSALNKTPLKSLSISCPEVDNLSPLKGMPLEDLNLSCPKVSDLSALQGMPLKALWITDTNVRDVSPLEGLPLEHLSVDLKRITGGIEVLRGIKSLKSINYCDSEQVWKEYDEGKLNKKKNGMGESGRGDGIAPVTPPTPPDMRVRIRRFQSDDGGGP